MDTRELVERANAGDRAALETLVASIQDQVYALCLRMLSNPSDAEDAAQEILIKVVTHLSTFRWQSAFSTWVHRIAANHLVDARIERNRRAAMSFEALGGMIDAGIAAATPTPSAVDAVLVEEVRITCTQAMLLCLDVDHRLAYILGEILELPGEEGAAILEIDPAAYRKRLSRAREAVLAFMQKRCGVLDSNNPCRCSLQVPYTIRVGMLDPNRLRFATHPTTKPHELRELLGLLDAAAVQRANPAYAAPDRLSDALRGVLRGGKDGPG